MPRRDEYSQVAESIPFDNDTNGFTADDVQAAIEEAAASGSIPPIETLTEFEAFEDSPNQNTASNGWVTKNNYPYTTAVKSAGDYVIDYSAQIGQSDKEKVVGFRVQFREGTGGSWTTLVDVRDGLSIDNGYQLRSGFQIITLALSTEFQVRLQWGQTDEGGTGRIRNAAIKIGKVSS